jgi:steroid delta-isomerase-like uncharacterized protein
MPSESVRFIETWFDEVWRQGNLDAVDAMMHPDAVMHGLNGPDVTGPAEFKPFVQQFRGAFPDIQIRVEQTIEQGDLIASRWVASMSHHGDTLGPPTHKQVQVTGMSIARLRDGQMVEGWNDWDRLTLMQAIGAVQPVQPAVPVG